MNYLNCESYWTQCLKQHLGGIIEEMLLLEMQSHTITRDEMKEIEWRDDPEPNVIQLTSQYANPPSFTKMNVANASISNQTPACTYWNGTICAFKGHIRVIEDIKMALTKDHGASLKQISKCPRIL